MDEADDEGVNEDQLNTSHKDAPRSSESRGGSAVSRKRSSSSQLVKRKNATVAVPVAGSKRKHSRSSGQATSRVLVGTSLPAGMSQLLRNLVQRLGGTYLTSFVQGTTHVITPPSTQFAPRTVKYLLGVLSGCWVVTADWLRACDESDCWLAEQPFEVKGDQHGLLGGPERARLLITAGDHTPLFRNFRLFLCGFFGPPNIPREELIRLCTAAGAKMLARLPAKLVAEEPETVASRGVKVVLCPRDTPSKEARKIYDKCGIIPISVAWLLDSISVFECLELSRYHLVNVKLEN